MGISGMTAYFGNYHHKLTGLYDICKLKSTDIVLISSAAGGVGEYAVQLAKMQGCRVIGVAGGKDKCDHVVKNLKADDCIDYKVLIKCYYRKETLQKN
jgi:NADPH-dependent curcumin reductase CurA